MNEEKHSAGQKGTHDVTVTKAYRGLSISECVEILCAVRHSKSTRYATVTPSSLMQRRGYRSKILN